MIKNILGALLLGLLLTACGKTPAETTDTTVQDSTAADAEAKGKAEEEAKRLAREKAEAERVAREEAERIEQARLAAEHEKGTLIAEFRKIEGVLIDYKGNLDSLTQYKLSLENLLAKFKLLNDQTFITNTNDILGKVNRLIAGKTPKKGTAKQFALENAKRIIEASKDGQATLQELRELTETINPYETESEFSGVEDEIKAAEQEMLDQGRLRIEKYLNQLGDNLEFKAAKNVFLQGKKEDVRAKEVLRLENLIALAGEKAADNLVAVRANLFDMFIRMLVIQKSLSRLLSLAKPNPGAISRAKAALPVLKETVKLINDSITGSSGFDQQLIQVVKDHFRQQLNKILSDTQNFEATELSHIKSNLDSYTKSFFHWPKQ